MAILFHPHAQERMKERGTTEDEVKSAVEEGEQLYWVSTQLFI